MSYEDKIIPAYALVVDGNIHGIMEMRGYYFSYWPLIPDMWKKYLPKKWHSFYVCDLIKGKNVCGSINSSER